MGAGKRSRCRAVLAADDDPDVREALVRPSHERGARCSPQLTGAKPCRCSMPEPSRAPCLVVLGSLMVPMDGCAFGTLRKPFALEEFLAVLDEHC